MCYILKTNFFKINLTGINYGFPLPPVLLQWLSAQGKKFIYLFLSWFLSMIKLNLTLAIKWVLDDAISNWTGEKKDEMSMHNSICNINLFR